MFDHKIYVPILRWKQAERLSLRDLPDDVCSRMRPLVQVVPESVKTGKRTPSVHQAFQKVAAEMRDCWGTRPLLVDLRHLDPRLRIGTAHPLAYIALQARANSVSMIPVTGLHKDSAYQASVRQTVADDRRGACLRLFRGDISSSNLRNPLLRLLGQLGLEPHNVDLVLDMEFHDATYPGFDSLVSVIPQICEWRTLAVASGAFPPDLTKWKTPGTYREPRRDWQSWLREIMLEDSLIRKPSFSDYGIYHPTYRPPPGFPNFSASIRYTDDDDWIVMRGEGVRNEGGAGFAQYPANAELLCAMAEFRGGPFSAGDAFIARKIGDYAHPGSASDWLQAGFNHHITFVVRQIANLFGT